MYKTTWFQTDTDKEMALGWMGEEDRTKDWFMTARLKWEETDGSYLLAQQTAQSLYPFILNSHPSLDSLFHWSFHSFTWLICAFHTLVIIPFLGYFSLLNIPLSNLHSILQNPIFLSSDSSAPSYSFAFLRFVSVALSVFLPSAVPGVSVWH